jgi:Tfp pilus assembly protein PilO
MLMALAVVLYALVVGAALRYEQLREKKAAKRSTPKYVKPQYRNKKEFMRAMEVERQAWLLELKSVFDSMQLPELEKAPVVVEQPKQEKVLMVRRNAVVDSVTGRKYLTIGEIIAAAM